MSSISSRGSCSDGPEFLSLSLPEIIKTLEKEQIIPYSKEFFIRELAIDFNQQEGRKTGQASKLNRLLLSQCGLEESNKSNYCLKTLIIECRPSSRVFRNTHNAYLVQELGKVLQFSDGAASIQRLVISRVGRTRFFISCCPSNKSDAIRHHAG